MFGILESWHGVNNNVARFQVKVIFTQYFVYCDWYAYKIVERLVNLALIKTILGLVHISCDKCLTYDKADGIISLSIECRLMPRGLEEIAQ